MPRLLGVMFVLASTTAFAGPHAGPRGRVLRVERVGGAQVAPRLCEIRGDTGTCVGDPLTAGQRVAVFDDRRVVAEVEIVEAASLVTSCASLWTVKMRAIHGATADGEGIGVIDPGLDPTRARLLDKDHLPASPSGLSGDEVWRAIDRDGDGAADILITRYSCDGAGKPVSGGGTSCIDVWARLGGKLIRTTQLNLARCNP